mmetsp:Transcript_24441/g.35736  ORF Transcript_24441/g.35736 Transcript_24441/m.35736 type:complete len:303 (+) Transcript_24441:196-1104(+)|eukprot:CAMPEP_0195526682 /NCGR_PEP_ID=MMETSP0794_2-20130614/27892_1 /TAXON_ID=515487 /ORGANISM="Stephanopyxis turris, Strain CCMP 815" /LENGTH=302 /DNA_ID=CAMNT_0040657429 /DNA_START=193 /DNA_END=1101 /DNA_ORIENTATION=+
MGAKNSSSYVTIGNILHISVLTNVMVYAFLIVAYAHPNETSKLVFDPEWLSQGFCVANLDVPYWNSHDLCLYADVILSISVVMVYYALRNGENIKDDTSLQHSFKWSSVSILTHGMAHGFMSYKLRQKEESGEALAHSGMTRWEEVMMEQGGNASRASIELAKTIPVALLFWFPLLKSGMNASISNVRVLLLSVLVMLGQMHIQPQFGFTYVQTVIFLVFGFNELVCKTAKEKSRLSYMILALTGVPLSLIPYWEAMACTSGGYKALGGHVLYDAAIPVSLIIAYVSCYYYQETALEKKKLA